MSKFFNHAYLIQGPGQIMTPDPISDISRPTLLIYGGCQGRLIAEYLKMAQSKFNIIRLEVVPMLKAMEAGRDVMADVAPIFKMAEVLLTSGIDPTVHLGSKHPEMSAESVKKLLKPSCTVLTAPDASMWLWWPICGGYPGGSGQEGVWEYLRRGWDEGLIWSAFENGTFDPKFDQRSEFEFRRMELQDEAYDIKILDFIRNEMKDHKLFWADSHPTYSLLAFVGSEALRLLNVPHKLELDDEAFQFVPFPETKYEWDHFGFTYPRRHTDNRVAFYRRQLSEAVKSWKP